jgi:hypothetical protein
MPSKASTKPESCWMMLVSWYAALTSPAARRWLRPVCFNWQTLTAECISAVGQATWVTYIRRASWTSGPWSMRSCRQIAGFPANSKAVPGKYLGAGDAAITVAPNSHEDKSSSVSQKTGSAVRRHLTRVTVFRTSCRCRSPNATVYYGHGVSGHACRG